MNVPLYKFLRNFPHLVIYEISYFYFSFIAVVVALLVGIIVSLVRASLIIVFFCP